jgi:hypothetical protein
MMKTFEEAQAVIDTMPAMLSIKGKSRPDAYLSLYANAGAHLTLRWAKSSKAHDWDSKYQSFTSKPIAGLVADALKFIQNLPDAETARLHDFMGQLGKLIDVGKDLGIEVDYLNPLTDAMKRLSENIITHQPSAA